MTRQVPCYSAAMEFADERAEALAMLRNWASQQAQGGMELWRIDIALRDGMQSVLTEFRIANDVAGVRYWYISPGEEFRTTRYGEPKPEPIEPGAVVQEVARWFWLGKQHLTDPEESL